MDSTCTAFCCANNVKDVFESDTDCGGVCGACETGDMCRSNNDCKNAYCEKKTTAGIALVFDDSQVTDATIFADRALTNRSA